MNTVCRTCKQKVIDFEWREIGHNGKHWMYLLGQDKFHRCEDGSPGNADNLAKETIPPAHSLCHECGGQVEFHCKKCGIIQVIDRK